MDQCNHGVLIREMPELEMRRRKQKPADRAMRQRTPEKARQGILSWSQKALSAAAPLMAAP